VESDSGTDGTIPAATSSLAGVLTASDKTKLDGIATGATLSNLSFTRNSTTLTLENSGGVGAILPVATTTLAGLLSAADKTTLDSLSAGTATNLTFTRNSTTLTVESSTGSDVILPAATPTLAGMMSGADKTKLDSLSGGSIMGSLSGSAWTVTHFGATNTTASLGLAGGGSIGLITSADKTKLDGIASGATLTNLGNTPAASTVTITNSGGSNTTLPAATPTLAGVMTGADKTKLDGIASGATLTNLGNTPAASTVTITNSGGNNTTLPAATVSLAGVMTSADKVFITPTTTTLTLVNGWANFGFGFITAQALKQGRIVSVAGVISGGTITPGTLISTIAVGYRPTGAIRFTVECSSGFVAITLEPDGSIRIREASAGASPATFTSLAFTYFVN
jgi:hypothetical protein